MARNPRAAAQRETAARVREFKRNQSAGYPRSLPRSITGGYGKAARGFGDSVLTGGDRPAKGSPEGKQLARLAGLASVGKIDAKYLEFSDYWYHENG